MLTAIVAGAILMPNEPNFNPRAGRELVFADEFDRGTPPDRDEWVYEVGKIRNREEQFYTEGRAENARIENGMLVLEARKEPFEGSEITSASLQSRRSWTHVYVEVRARFPTGRGTWPAIWMLGDSIRKHGTPDYVGWPRCGEIDIMENVGFDPEVIHFTVHNDAYNHVRGTHKSATVTVPRAWETFHTYGLDWRPDRLDFYFNDRKVFTYANDGKGEASWPYDKPHFLILNLAIGGTWGGSKGVDDAIFPCRFEIEYVRVYR
ncbi:MAG: glycoside hydrolase family 16 protein [Fimbriimonadaceae bacterium]